MEGMEKNPIHFEAPLAAAQEKTREAAKAVCSKYEAQVASVPDEIAAAMTYSE